MTFGSYIRGALFGKQGRRNLQSLRATGRAFLPGLTKRIEGFVGKHMNTFRGIGQVGKAGLDLADAVQRTDLGSGVDALSRGAKAAGNLVRNMRIGRAGGGLKRMRDSETKGSVSGVDNPNGGKRPRISGDALSRLVRSATGGMARA